MVVGFGSSIIAVQEGLVVENCGGWLYAEKVYVMQIGRFN